MPRLVASTTGSRAVARYLERRATENREQWCVRTIRSTQVDGVRETCPTHSVLTSI